MPDLAGETRELLEKRKSAKGAGFVLVLGSAPREKGTGVKHGVGRTAVADAVAQAIGAERLSTGKVFRDLAAERGMPIEEFHRGIAEHPEWDADLDRRVASEIAKAKKTGRFLVVDSNLAALLSEPDLSVRIDVPDGIRACRVMEGHRYGDREFASDEEALAFLDERSAQEAKRYASHLDPLYDGVDITDPNAYQATVKNTGTLEEAVQAVLQHVLSLFGKDG
jgi:cytidylate kinase